MSYMIFSLFPLSVKMILFVACVIAFERENSDDEDVKSYRCIVWAVMTNLLYVVAHGPSGANTEYLFKLVEFSRTIGIADAHLDSLDAKVKSILDEFQEAKRM